MPTPPAQVQFILTIMPDGTMSVSLRDADNAQSPALTIPVDQDRRLGVLVASVQALARQQLAAVKSPWRADRGSARWRTSDHRHS